MIISNATPNVLADLRIHKIRETHVVVDSDLASVYNVETKQLNRAVKRNAKRFPSDFAFQLNKEGFANLRCQTGTSTNQGVRRYPSWVFSEHGEALWDIFQKILPLLRPPEKKTSV